MPQPAALARTDEPSIHDVIEPPARLHATTNLFSPTSHLELACHPKLADGKNQSSYAKASEDIQRALRERRMVEPDGIEPTT